MYCSNYLYLHLDGIKLVGEECVMLLIWLTTYAQFVNDLHTETLFFVDA